MTASHRTRARQKGASLIEVLVSLVLISIGLLGISASQLTSLKLTLSAYQRSQATVIANDIADRMRANITEAEKTSSKYLTAVPNGIDHGSDCVNYTGVLTNTCSSADMAEQDVFDWRLRIQQELNGEGIICRDNSPNDGSSALVNNCDSLATSPLVIKLWWDDDRNPDTVAQLFATSVEL